jgi:cytochrome P450
MNPTGVLHVRIAHFVLGDAKRRIDRLLMPAFGPMAIRGMIEEMRDICDQLILKVR